MANEKQHVYTVRFDDEEKAAARRRATEVGVDMATYIRHLVRRDAGLPTLGGAA